VGAGEGQDRKRFARAAVQGYLYVAPGYIQPMHGIRSKTKLYQALYTVVAPTYPFVESALREVHHHDGRLGTRDDQDRKTRRAQAHPRESGHKQCLIVALAGILAALFHLPASRGIRARSIAPQGTGFFSIQCVRFCAGSLRRRLPFLARGRRWWRAESWHRGRRRRGGCRE
jgi:hypothetical protein